MRLPLPPNPLKRGEASVPNWLGAPIKGATLIGDGPSVLTKVLEYCSHHRNDPLSVADEPDEIRRRATDISEWDARFIQVDQEMLFEIILAANYLDIKSLLDIGCKTVYVR